MALRQRAETLRERAATPTQALPRCSDGNRPNASAPVPDRAHASAISSAVGGSSCQTPLGQPHTPDVGPE